VGSRAFLGFAFLAACSAMPPTRTLPRESFAVPVPTTVADGPTAPVAPPPEPSREPTPFGSEEAEQILFADDTDSAARAACFRDHPEPERVGCLLRVRYRGDAEATSVALAMHAQSGNIAGVQPAQLFDGGYRGVLKFVPSLPTGQARTHLAWVAAAFRDYEQLFADLGAPSSTTFRWRALEVRFFRSLKVRTPSAFAQGWSIGYNLSGSLNVSEQWVRETMFHELFHLNDEAHGNWSTTALASIHAAIKQKCGASTPCLRPYAPSSTIVNGSTYYAFHPKNPVTEYGGELALRYYREHRAILRKEALTEAPFKCGPEENARAWSSMVKEFFGGIDRVPACTK
jgi:hypothetical protein